ncbi:TPA: hypothetical protein ACH3X2_008127 [Trebouxia sp. C0005]|nr:MAG: voltage-dependent anion-selective channel [Trebouxia sp. A1-2]
MSAKIPAFSDIGKSTKDLLYGGGNTGAFQFNNVLNLSSTTADGVEFTATSTQKGDSLETIVKAAYGSKNYKFASSILPDGKALLSITAKNLAPNLTAVLSGTLPDEQSGKVVVDYSVPHLTLKTTVGLTQNPKVVLAATTGQKGVVAGAEVSYDTNKGNVTTWNAGIGYNAADFQASVHLTEAGDALKASFAHNIDAYQSYGAEVYKNAHSEDVSFLLGYSKRLRDGALTKAKVQNNGNVTLLYEAELKPKTKIGISGQFDATNPNTKPKVGFAFDLKN